MDRFNCGVDKQESALDSLIPVVDTAQWRRGGQTITSASIADMSTAIDTFSPNICYIRTYTFPTNTDIIIKVKLNFEN